MKFLLYFLVTFILLNNKFLISETLYPEVEKVFEIDYGIVQLSQILVDDVHFFAVWRDDIYFKDINKTEWKQLINQPGLKGSIENAEIFQDKLFFVKSFKSDSLYVTNENFTSWEEISKRIPSSFNFNSYSRISSDGIDNLFITTGNCVIRTTDGGLNWSRIDTTIKDTYISFGDLFYNTFNHTIYLTHALGFFTSSDYGLNWIYPKDFHQPNSIRYFAFDDFGNTYAFVDVNNQPIESYYGLFKKSQNEENFSQKYKSSKRIRKIKVFENLIISNTDSTIIVSSDRGESWKEYNVFVNSEWDQAIADFLVFNDTLYIVFFGNTLYSIGIDKLVSVAEQNITELQVYPNPANDYIIISNDNTIEEIKIIDINGKNVLHQNINTNNSIVFVQNLPNGLYNIMVKTKGKYQSKSFLIMR